MRGLVTRVMGRAMFDTKFVRDNNNTMKQSVPQGNTRRLNTTAPIIKHSPAISIDQSGSETVMTSLSRQPIRERIRMKLANEEVN